MIHFRRVLATIIGIAFLFVFFATLGVWQVNGIVRDTSFFQKHIREAELFDDIYPVIVSDALERYFTEDNVAGFELPYVVDNASALAETVLAPEWIEEQVAHVIGEVHPYLIGTNDSFNVKIEISDRVSQLAEVIQEPEHQNFLHALFIQEFLAPLVVDSLQELLDMEITSDKVINAIERSIPSDALLGQTAEITEQIVKNAAIPDEEELFRLEIKELVYSSLIGSDAPLKVMLKDTGAYEAAVDMLIPLIVEELNASNTSSIAHNSLDGSVIKIKIGENLSIELTSEEIQSFLEDSLAEMFRGHARIDQIFDPLILYFVGENDAFSIALDSSDLSNLFTGFVNEKFLTTFEMKYRELPECDPKTAILFAQRQSTQELPNCRVVGLSVEQIQIAAGLPIFPSLTRSQVEHACSCSIDSILSGLDTNQMLEVIGFTSGISDSDYKNMFPDQIMFGNMEMIAMFGESGHEIVNNVRTFVQNGYVVRKTDTLFGSDPLHELLIYKYVSEGIKFNESDFALWMESDSDDQRPAEVDKDPMEDRLKDIHVALSTLERVTYPLIALSVLLLVIVSILGGRGWRGRLQWFGTWGLVASSLLITLTGPIYHYGIAPALINGRLVPINALDMGQAGAANRLLIDRMLSLMESMIGAMVLPILVACLMVAVGAILLLVFVRFYHRGKHNYSG
ncbi:MAG: hypothetical protein FI725_03485 [SAR202 cluster bacterium]|nr:hypothetical protein [SAR202 cluster bacterium]|tara:strand:- start:1080 stop:3125 length:2046 start_codon:yes stop_codon:yes gene_type:complete